MKYCWLISARANMQSRMECNGAQVVVCGSLWWFVVVIVSYCMYCTYRVLCHDIHV